MKYRFQKLNRWECENVTNGMNLPLTQNAFYGEWQILAGKNVWRFVIKDDSQIIGVFQVIKNTMMFGKSYLYIPHGPYFIQNPGDEFNNQFEKFVGQLLKQEKAVFLRLDSTWKPDFQVTSSYMYDGGFQPKYEWVLDLTKTEALLLAGMKKVNRYTIRQAEKFGVKVEIVKENFSNHFDKFYELISITAKRDEFSHFPKEYYKKIFDTCEKDKNAFLVIGYYDDEILLVNFYTMFGDVVYFLFSGASDKERKIGYTYLAQWEAIKEAKRLGYKVYNFGGYTPENCKYIFYKKWAGFSDFKRRFGGRMMEYSDFYDIVGDKFWYFLYKLKRFIKSIKVRPR